MKANYPIEGTGVAIVTPFHNYGTIDFTHLEKLVNNIIEGGIDFVVALGTTSEAATLTYDEKTAVMDCVIETVKKRVPIVMGMGGNSTQSVVTTIRNTDFDNIAAILSVAPYYNKPNQKGLFYHFKNIAAASPLPVILYNVPGRTGSNLSAETTLRLATEMHNVIAIKEASGNMTQVMEILHNRPNGFKVFSGDDALTYSLLSLGADGVISVVANVYPRAFSNMVRLARSGNFDEALKIHFSLLPFIKLLFADGNPAGVKAALEKIDILKNNLRLPMVKANKSVSLQLEKFLQEYEYPLKETTNLLV